ncbi:hypothetical protein EMIT093MI4_70044 [Pseudomonas sp. IT-93MI4]
MQRIPVRPDVRDAEAGLKNRQTQKRPLFRVAFFDVWLREPDLNRRPSGYEPDELPDCSIPRLCVGILQRIAGVSTLNLDKSVPVQSVSAFSSAGDGRAGQAGQGFQLYRSVILD